MTSATDSSLADGAITLRALNLFRELLFVPNNVVPARPRLLYRSPALRPTLSDEALVERCGFVIASPADGFIGLEALDRKLAHKPVANSDFYVCHGSRSAGSGRSVLLDGLQVKGVGRTIQAPWHGNASESHGRVFDRWMVHDVGRGAFLAKLLTTPVIAPAACLLLARGDVVDSTSHVIERDSFLVVREGSPLRVAHLQFLRGATKRMLFTERLARARAMVNVLLGGTDTVQMDVATLLAFFGGLLDRTMTLVAEARVFSIYLTHVADNADVFARPFDFEDVRFLAPRVVTNEAGLRPPDAGEEPTDYFQRHPFVFGIARDPYWSSLGVLQAGLETVGLLAEAVGLSDQSILPLLSWAGLRARYRAAIGRVLGSLVDSKLDPLAVVASAKQFVAALPLVPPVKNGSSWSSRELVEGVVRRTKSGGVTGSASNKCGAALVSGARAVKLSPRGAFLLNRSGEEIEARFAGLVAELRAVDEGDDAERRTSTYRRLLVDATTLFDR